MRFGFSFRLLAAQRYGVLRDPFLYHVVHHGRHALPQLIAQQNHLARLLGYGTVDGKQASDGQLLPGTASQQGRGGGVAKVAGRTDRGAARMSAWCPRSSSRLRPAGSSWQAWTTASAAHRQ